MDLTIDPLSDRHDGFIDRAPSEGEFFLETAEEFEGHIVTA
jgi:hypothetical protein